MKKIFFKTVGLCAILMVAASCTKTTNNTYNSSINYNTLAGNIQGFVHLYNSSMITTPLLIEGDTVAITNNLTNITYKTITDETGTYHFNNLSAGTYSFVITKPGYGLTKSFGFELVGGGTVYKNFSLGQIPTENVVTAQAIPDTGAINIAANIPSNETNASIAIYISIPSHTEVSNAEGDYSCVFITSVSGTSTLTLNNFFTKTFLYNLGFTSGSKIYFSLYQVNTNSNYVSPITNLSVFTALSNTPVVVSAVVP
ncbi:MAG: carboxypeptidase regulatory-like domain-containing protein [Bacteroidetes bacterium]|nr:carboxypeptidase regulatory-like domain-containing protein [Bacteroidota bacterium]